MQAKGPRRLAHLAPGTLPIPRDATTEPCCWPLELGFTCAFLQTSLTTGDLAPSQVFGKLQSDFSRCGILENAETLGLFFFSSCYSAKDRWHAGFETVAPGGWR